MLKWLIFAWHRWMDMPLESPQWYLDKIEGEITELVDARGCWARLSERGDVLYSYSRAEFDGIAVLGTYHAYLHLYIALYMVIKLTLRRLYYKRVGARMDPPKDMKALRNPQKDDNLRSLAIKHGYDEIIFLNTAKKIRSRWLFLP